MILIEFDKYFTDGLNIIKYRSIDDDSWYYMYIDIETLSKLLFYFGIIGTLRIPTRTFCCDNPSTSNILKIKYCGADVEIVCKNKTRTRFNLEILEQNY